MRRPLTLAIAALALSSCAAVGTQSGTDQATSTPETLAFVDHATPAPSSESGSASPSSSPLSANPPSSSEPGLTTDDATPGAGQGLTAGADSAIGSGTQTQPVGSAPDGTQAPAELMAQYHGQIGNYTLNQLLFGAAAPAPQPTPGVAPLTGLPGTAAGPAVVVKVDNSSAAQPQLGLNQADIIIEEEVEWGITRLAAIYQSQHTTVGPIRSGRTTDISFLGSLGTPALVYSGANQIIDTLLLRHTYVQNYSAARSDGYWRDSNRRAPSNLFANSDSFNANGAPPDPWFAYADAGTISNGVEATSIVLTLGSTNVVWQWNQDAWTRTQSGAAHLTGANQPITATNIVVAYVPRVDTGMVDSAGGTVPEFVWAGQGAVSVYRDGKRVDGTWTRPSLADPAILVDGDGNVIELVPGRTWVELVSN